MTTLRTRLALVFVALLAPVLASCGFEPQTDQVYVQGRGVSDRSGDVEVLNVVVVSHTAGSGTVVASLVNNGEEDDALSGVSVGGSEATLARKDAELPVNAITDLGVTGAVGASSPEIEEGTFVEVVFSFENAEAVTVEAPVVPHDAEYEDIPLADTAE